jgi:transcription antitermination factor NusG
MVAIAATNVVDDARRDVKDVGLATYAPLYRERSVVRGKVRWLTRHLLGRYFFIRDDQSDLWKRILGLRSVAGMILWREGQEPAIVADAEVDAIRAREDRSGFVKDAPRLLNRGDAVRVGAGCLIGGRGSYEGVSAKNMDVAWIEMFGRPTKIEFAPGVLRAA